ncbi:MAG: hypothetical protein MUP11_09670 [Anaerolineales bacterium]|nr:hypothetical protein [Anaerolineales bacterium]
MVRNWIKILTTEGKINIRSIINPDKIGSCVFADVFIEVEPGNLRAEAIEKSGRRLISS